MAYKPPYEIVKAADADYTVTGDGIHKVRRSFALKGKAVSVFSGLKFYERKIRDFADFSFNCESSSKIGKEPKKMIPKIQKILYATDLSPNSKYAFRYAINSAIKHDARIIILHVVESMPAAVYAQMGVFVGDEKAGRVFEKRVGDALDRLKKRLTVFCEKELADDPQALNRVQSIEICEGFPAEEILEKANELDCDAIVMGTHSKGVIANTFLGSIAKRVLRRTRKPVFIIPLPKGETEITFYSD